MDPVVIKKPSNKNFRRRKRDSDEDESGDDDTATLEQVEEARLLREMKKRKHGVDITIPPPTSNQPLPDLSSVHDPLRLKSGGGLANMNALRALSSDAAEETTATIGTAFAAETKRRDEDLELLRYVEEEMNKKRGADKEANEDSKSSNIANPKAKLFELPEYLKVTSAAKKKEGHMSSQMLTGIPEVDLGLE